MNVTSLIRSIAAVFVSCAVLLGLTNLVRAAGVSEETVKKITEAMPAKATAEPAKARKILVFNKCEGYVHSSIPVADKMLEIMGKKTGAFEVTITDDTNMLDPEKLAGYDAIILNNTTQWKLNDPKQREALLNFVKGGKGLIGIHAATDNFYNWPEGAEMMGGLFDGHPWVAEGTWAVKIDEPKHTLNKGFDNKGFTVKDELYQIKAPYSRDKLRVLASLDMSKAQNKVGGRKDNDNPLSWIHDYGKGRVFYCAFGHNDEVFWNKGIVQHYLDGIQWALGDLKADSNPSAKLDKQPEPAPAP